jgi:AcrR family transcriptional regulator
MEARDRILQESWHLFFAYGIKSITMDDIARHLSISKKTLYEHFEDKDALVTAVFKAFVDKVQQDVIAFKTSCKDAVEELIKGSEYMGSMMKSVNPATFVDLRKHYPAAWQLFHENHKVFMIDTIRENLERGIEQGLYRQGLDLNIVALSRLFEIEMCMDPEKFPQRQFNIDKVQLTSMDIFMHGISTLKGHKLINKYKKIHEDE